MLSVPLVLTLLLTQPSDTALAAATAHLESDGDPTATECPRAPGPHRHHDDPSSASPAAPCFAGLFQTTCTSRAECLAQRDPAVGIAAWRRQRGQWRSLCRARGARDVELCTVAGYATGVAGALAAVGADRSPQGLRGVAYARRLLRLARALAAR